MFVVLGILLMTFVLMRAIPADPARMAAGPRATPEQVAQIRERLGLNDSLYEQFVGFLGQLARGDLGTSFITQREVSYDIRAFLPATLELTLVATLVMALIGIAAGLYLSLKPGALGASLVRGSGYLGIAAPVFLTGIIAQLVFYGHLGWLPSGSRTSGEVPTGITGMYLVDSLLTANFPAFLDAVRHLALPVLILALSRAGVIMRFVEAEMHAALASDYAATARAKGAGQARVVFRHGFRNALGPVTSMIGMQFGWLIGGAVPVEIIFSWPGLGTYMVSSITSLDVAPVIITAIVLGLIFALVNLAVDVANLMMDPRIAR